MAQRFSKSGHRPDYFLLAIVFILTILGLVILASASSDIGKIKFDDSYYFLKHQLLNGLLPGLLGFLIAYFFHYQNYRKLSFFVLLGNLILLALVFTPFGIIAGGASRALQFGPIRFQPAELLKISYILYLAAWLSNPRLNRARDFLGGLVPFLIVSGTMALLLLFQPATSVVVILLATGGAVYFMSGANIGRLILVGLGGLLILGLIIMASPYRRERMLTFLNPDRDSQKASYQINQALIAIGSGGLTGVGYGQSASKVKYLPTPLDDSIFAVAAQELGFIGAGFLITLFGLLVFRLFWLARRVRDRFGQLILVGFAIIIALQSLVNMGAISGLFPLTGVPLPFVSYGGTALAIFLTMMGISVNISKYS